MFPNLMGMKEYHHLSSEEMGAIINTSRQTYESKMQRGSFTPLECKAYWRRFGKSFDYLFATFEEAEANVSYGNNTEAGSSSDKQEGM